MPIRPSKDVIAKYIELSAQLVAETESFAKSRGESFKAVVEMALRRHMANPPPPPVPQPLPPLVPLPPVGASDPTEDETKEQTALKPGKSLKKGKK